MLVLCLCCSVTAEIRSFSGFIEADSSFIHYSDGYLVAPGYVDISGLKFSTLDYVPDNEIVDDDMLAGQDDDDIGDDEVGAEDAHDPEDGGGGRMLDEANQGSDGSVVSDCRIVDKIRLLCTSAHTCFLPKILFI